MPHQPSPQEKGPHSQRSEPQPASTHPLFSCLTFALPHMLQQALISVSDAYNYVYLNNTNYLSPITSTPLEFSSLLVRATRDRYLFLPLPVAVRAYILPSSVSTSLRSISFLSNAILSLPSAVRLLLQVFLIKIPFLDVVLNPCNNRFEYVIIPV